MSWIKSTWKHRIRLFVLQKEFLFSFFLLIFQKCLRCGDLVSATPRPSQTPWIMGLISSISKETFSFCHCWHPQRNLKRSLTLLPSSPIVLTVITQMLIAQKAAVRLGFKSPLDASGVISRINESEALKANELLWTSSTGEAFAWVGQCGQPVSADAAFTERLTEKANKLNVAIYVSPLLPSRVCLLLYSPASRTTWLPVWPPGPQPPGSRPEGGEAQTQGGPILPAHRRRVLLSIFALFACSLTGQESKQQVSSLFFLKKKQTNCWLQKLHTLPHKVIMRRERTGLRKMCNVCFTADLYLQTWQQVRFCTEYKCCRTSSRDF